MSARTSVYFDTASYGLGPPAATEAMSAAIAQWQRGEANWMDWDDAGEDARLLVAQLLNAEWNEIALLPAVSVASAMVLTTVPDRGEVLVAEDEFRSLLFPALVAAGRRDLRVIEVPREEISEHVRPSTHLVMASLVSASDGYVLDWRSLSNATRSAGARLYLDGTQALGVVPLDIRAEGIDFLSCACYKWLCAPRGAAFLYTSARALPTISPLAAGWRSTDFRRTGYFGGPLDLPRDSRSLDVSLAWFSWIGAKESLRVLLDIPSSQRFALATAPAKHIAEQLGLPAPRASILSVDVGDAAALSQELEAAGIRASIRSDRLRVSSHVYNTVDEAEALLEVIDRTTNSNERGHRDVSKRLAS